MSARRAAAEGSAGNAPLKPFIAARMAMTGDELKDIRKALGLSQAELSDWLLLRGNPGWTVRMWEKENKPISGPAEIAVRAFAAGYRPPHVVSKDTPLSA